MKTSAPFIGSLFVGVLFVAVGCGAGKGESPELRIDRVNIDSGEELEVEPGQGVGVHMEVDGEGRWTTSFSCDTERSGYVCGFDLIASVEPPGELRAVRAQDLEADDYWYRIDAGAVGLLASTAYDLDGLAFTAPVGERLRVDVLLDGVSAPEAVAWVDNGRVRRVAPSMPFELVPRE